MLFQESEWFYLTLLIPLIIGFFVYSFHRRRALLNRFGDSNLVTLLIKNVSTPLLYGKAFLIVLIFFLMIVTLARPKWGAQPVTLTQKGVDIVFVIDASRSMLAEDITPNRLERAKLEISDFVERLKGDRIGLTIFAGSCYTACPLTVDYNAFTLFLREVHPSLMARQGTRLGDAIRLAQESFLAGERKYKAMILLTDGEDHGSDPLAAAEAAKEEGIRVYTIGIGNPEGEPIPVKDPTNENVISYVKDARGKVVMSRLDKITLHKIANETGGKYYHSSSGELGLDAIYEDISQMEKKELRAKHFTRYQDRFQVFALFLVTLLIVEFLLSERKRVRVNKEERYG